MDEPPGLVGVVALGDVFREFGDGFPGIVIEGDAGLGALGLGGLFFKVGDDPLPVDFNRVVFLDRLQVFDVVGGEHGLAALAGFGEFSERFAKEVVSRDDHEVRGGEVFASDDQVDVADGPEFVGIVLGTVVDLEFELAGAGCNRRPTPGSRRQICCW